jgi:hypothetical protein
MNAVPFQRLFVEAHQNVERPVRSFRKPGIERKRASIFYGCFGGWLAIAAVCVRACGNVRNASLDVTRVWWATLEILLASVSFSFTARFQFRATIPAARRFIGTESNLGDALPVNAALLVNS